MNNLFLTVCFFLTLSTLFAQTITITGSVIDDDTEEATPFCSVYVLGTNNGVTTDIDGNYILTMQADQGDTLATNSLGYDDVLKAIDTSKTEQVIDFRMRSSTLDLGISVVVEAGENPANEIIRQIIKNKNKNDLEEIVASYQTELYTKMELDLVNITQDMKDMKIFKKLQFIFDNIDTVSDVKPFLPAYVAERFYNVYYVQGSAKKEILKAQRV